MTNDHFHLHFASLSSTNDFLESLTQKENLTDGSIVSADYQTSGRGMIENKWESDSGKNLLFSLLYLPKELPVNEQFYLSKAVSLGIFDALKQILPGSEINIKWPNDLYAGGKKIGGILIKNTLKGQNIQQSIIGIGLNVNQTRFSDAFEATSVMIENADSFPVNRALEIVIKCLDERLKSLNINDFNKINADYHNQLLGIGQWMNFRTKEKEFTGKILEVAKDGRLLVETKDGQTALFEVKEIRLVSALPAL